MKVPSFIYPVGKDINGQIWFFDARQRRIYTRGDETPRAQRGHPCKSFLEAKRILSSLMYTEDELYWKNQEEQAIKAGKEKYKRNSERVQNVLEQHLDFNPEKLAESILEALALDGYKPKD